MILDVELIENEQRIDATLDSVIAVGGGEDSGQFWDFYQQNGNRTDYKYAFYGLGVWNDATFKPKYSIELEGTPTAMCQWLGRGDGVTVDMSKRDIDASKITSAQAMFMNANVKNVSLDLSACRSLSGTFNNQDGGGYVENITLKVTEELTNASQAFNKCTALTNLTFTEDSVIACNGLNLSTATNLTHDSLMSIINALEDKITKYGEYFDPVTVTFGATNLAKLSQEEIAIAEAKGWTVK